MVGNVIVIGNVILIGSTNSDEMRKVNSVGSDRLTRESVSLIYEMFCALESANRSDTFSSSIIEIVEVKSTN